MKTRPPILRPFPDYPHKGLIIYELQECESERYETRDLLNEVTSREVAKLVETTVKRHTFLGRCAYTHAPAGSEYMRIYSNGSRELLSLADHDLLFAHIMHELVWQSLREIAGKYTSETAFKTTHAERKRALMFIRAGWGMKLGYDSDVLRQFLDLIARRCNHRDSQGFLPGQMFMDWYKFTWDVLIDFLAFSMKVAAQKGLIGRRLTASRPRKETGKCLRAV